MNYVLPAGCIMRFQKQGKKYYAINVNGSLNGMHLVHKGTFDHELNKLCTYNLTDKLHFSRYNEFILKDKAPTIKQLIEANPHYFESLVNFGYFERSREVKDYFVNYKNLAQ